MKEVTKVEAKLLALRTAAHIIFARRILTFLPLALAPPIS